MEDGKNRTVGLRIDKLVAVPCGRGRSGFGFPIADNAGGNEIGIVQDGTVSRGQCVAEFAALMNDSRQGRAQVAGKPSRIAEGANESVQAFSIALQLGIEFL